MNSQGKRDFLAAIGDPLCKSSAHLQFIFVEEILSLLRPNGIMIQGPLRGGILDDVGLTQSEIESLFMYRMVEEMYKDVNVLSGF